MAITRNTVKTAVRNENTNRISNRNQHWQNTIGGKGNSHGVCYRVGKPFPKPVVNGVSRRNLHGGSCRSFPKSAPNVMGRRVNSHGACYRVGKPFPKPIAKPVKFRSYASKRNTNNKRNIYTIDVFPFSSADDTPLQRWNAFYSNGRAVKGKSNRIFRNSCTLFCEVTLVNSELHSFWTKSCSTEKGPHAEVKALEEIRNLEKGCDLWKVDMLLSYSPCANCADAIIKFKGQRRPSVQISLAFTAIFRDDEMIHCQGLQRLDSEPGIMLRVFTENDWVRLAKETDVDYYRNKSRKDQDAYWYQRLQEILKKRDDVLDIGVDDSSILPHPGFTPSKKCECLISTTLFLVIVLVVIALVFKLSKL